MRNAARTTFPLALLTLAGAGFGQAPIVLDNTPVPIGPKSGQVRAADVNLDGRMDFVVAATHPSNEVRVFLGSAGGGFTQAPIVNPGGSPYRFVVADVNNDSKPDLSMGVNSTNFATALGNGDGTFGSMQVHGSTTFFGQVVMADINHDNKLDAILADGSAFSYFLGAGNGAFAPKVTITQTGPIFAAGVSTGDYNGDSHVDVCVTTNSGSVSNALSLYLGNGAGAFAFQWSSNASAASSTPLTGDLNNDGTLDIARGINKITSVFPAIPGFVEVRFHPTAPSGGATQQFGSIGLPLDPQVKDVNSDGYLDIVLADPVGISGFSGGGILTLLRSTGAGAYGAQENYPVGIAPSGFALADFTSDGITDLIGADTSSETATLLTGSPGGSFFRKSFPTGAAPAGVATADFNFDGFVDAAVVNGGSSTLSILPGTGIGDFLPKTDVPVGANPGPVVCADLDGDSRLDAVVVNKSGSSFSVLLNSVSGFGPKTDYPTASQPVNMALGDLNLDGALDLAVVNTGFGAQNVAVNLGDGIGGFSPLAGFGMGTIFFPGSVAIGDLTSDGVPDVVITNESGFFLSVFQGDGAGNLTTQTNFNIGPTGFTPFAVSLTDLQLDGITDMVATTYNGYVSSFLGIGSGGFTPVPEIATGEYVKFARCSDLNGDGFPDLIATVQPLKGGYLTLTGDGTGGFMQLSKYSELAANGICASDLDADGDLDLLMSTFTSGGLLMPVLNKTAQPAGLATVPGGTPSCHGAGGIRGSAAPKIGSPEFLVVGSNAPATTLGLTLVADQPDFLGSDPFFLGILTNLNFATSSMVLGFDAHGDATGYSRTLLPIPNDPLLIGLKFYVQNLYLGCSLTPFHLSTSSLMEIIVQE